MSLSRLRTGFQFIGSPIRAVSVTIAHRLRSGPSQVGFAVVPSSAVRTSKPPFQASSLVPARIVTKWWNPRM